MVEFPECPPNASEMRGIDFAESFRRENTLQRKITFWRCVGGMYNWADVKYCEHWWLKQLIFIFFIFSSWIPHCYPGVYKRVANDKNVLHYFIITNRQKSRPCIDFSLIWSTNTNCEVWVITHLDRPRQQTDQTSVPNANFILVFDVSFRFELRNIFKTFGSKIIFYACIMMYAWITFKMGKMCELLNTLGTLLHLQKNIDTLKI